MTFKKTRIRYKRRLILYPYTAVRRVKEKTADGQQKPPLIDGISPVEETRESEVKTVAQLSEELASFKVGENPYAYFVSQLPSMLSAIPNLLQDDHLAIETVSAKENADELQTTMQGVDSRSEPQAAAENLSVTPAVTSGSGSSAQPAAETAHSGAYAMAENKKTTGSMANSAANKAEDYMAQSTKAALPVTPAGSVADEQADEKMSAAPCAAAKISNADKNAAQKQIVIDETTKTSNSGWRQQWGDGWQTGKLSLPPVLTQKRAAPLWLAWKDDDAENHAGCLFATQAGGHLYCPGRPQPRYLQIRFGGQQKRRFGADKAGDGNPDFLSRQLTLFAEQQQYSLPELLLRLSSIDAVRTLFAKQPLQTFSRHSLRMPDIAVQQLTLSRYLNHLFLSDLLMPNFAGFAQILAASPAIERLEMKADQLAVFFRYIIKHNQQGLFKLTMDNRVTYIELRAPQLQIYSSHGEVTRYSCAAFLVLLAELKFAARQIVSCEIFNLPGDFRQQLAGQLQRAAPQWQKVWHRHLFEFIILAVAPVDTTELSF